MRESGAQPLILPLFTFHHPSASFPLPSFSPPPLLSEGLGNADVIWLGMAPGHVSICLPSFLMTTRRLTFC